MGNIKQFNIENRIYYFFNDKINSKSFEPNLLEMEKKLYKNIDIYYIGHVTIKNIDDYENVYSENLCIWLLVK